MSVDPAHEFVDTNVLVYAFDPSAAGKHLAAGRLLERLWREGTGCVSVQVLQEFFVIVTRKVANPLTTDEAENRVREFAAWKVFAPGADDVLAGIALHKKARISFWDAMVVTAASEGGCSVLWTEDLDHVQTIQGVRIQNPFKAS